MIKGFEHVGTDHRCNVCASEFTDDEGGMLGYFGENVLLDCRGNPVGC